MTNTTPHDLARQVAVLEERMNTHQAKYESAIDRLRADLAKRDVWIVLTVLGVVAVLLAVHGWITTSLG